MMTVHAATGRAQWAIAKAHRVAVVVCLTLAGLAADWVLVAMAMLYRGVVGHNLWQLGRVR